MYQLFLYLIMSKIILASSSPRRAELLKALNINFSIKKYDFNEKFPSTLSSDRVARFLAENKAQQIDLLNEQEIVITSDTIVILNNKVLGKPNNRSEAINTLEKLSNSSHKVITGVCIKSNTKQFSFDDTTTVFFRKLTQEEIIFYVDQFSPYDKAGSYGIQEWIGLIGIEKIEGSYFNVMGLPVHKVYEYLQKF